ncbi:voltage-dependent calcium channel type A subunit alpha-1-like [Tachypleus tridentatus]|uniref:voltage-dependent calcium channel type A subunit alpha-1-like n=1 Tax=Tachypleus tridentatus TaxID=6853 RepID=UPI003FCF2678
MIGAAGSRHFNSRRRGSSPNTSPLHHYKARTSLTTHEEEDENSFGQKRKKTATKTPTRLSIPDLPPDVSLNRRRAVDTSDHKTCALVQTKLKRMRLEDVALRALKAGAGEGGRGLSTFSEYGGLTNQRSVLQAMPRKKGVQYYPGGKAPTSLFIFKEDNIIRRYTKFIIEWPYPLVWILIEVVSILGKLSLLNVALTSILHTI